MLVRTRPTAPIGRRPPTSSTRKARKSKIGVIDLFCGAGGLTRGFIDAGLLRLGVDVDEACQYPYEKNNAGVKFLACDVSHLRATVLKDAWKGVDVRVLAGCAPCQAFSSYTQGLRWKRADQWALLRAFSHLIRSSKPHVVTMENVPTLRRHRVFDRFCNSLTEQGFKITWDILDCRDFGIPQARKRLVLIASRLGAPKLPRPTHADPRRWKTVRHTIQRLPAIRAGTTHPNDALHVSSRLTPINLKRLRSSSPGGTWREWPPSLVAQCHTKGARYPGVYGRMEWDMPGPTITGQCFGFGNGRFGHPRQARGISLREAALLQTFPARYSFAPPHVRISIKKVGQLIGNAVPPRLARAIGMAIAKHISDRTEKGALRE
jgi:DNA (cytosine-5)-methyltransferase 1